jgi:membrane-associated phospholipid phosphatase
MQRFVFGIVVALLACVSIEGAARADSQAPTKPVDEVVVGHPPAVMFPPPVLERPKTDVYWHEDWPRFSFFELLLSAAVTARNADLGTHLDGPGDALVKFEVPILDKGGRALLRGSGPSQRAGARRISDLGFRLMVLSPYILDEGFGALVLHQNADVALQLALIDFEVFTLAGMTQLLGSRLTGRVRPSFYDTGCPPEGCPKGDDFRSFLSGHAMASFTGAGLICVHHEMIPLFGGGAPDTLACAWGVAAATLTGTMRIVADEHWTSDVMLGAAVGWGFGYYLPKLLHFHTKYIVRKHLQDGKPSAVTWMPTFAGTADGATAGIAGQF